MIIRIVIPLIKIRKTIINQNKENTDRQKEGEVTIGHIPGKEKIFTKDLGSYVDFKEE